MMTFLRDNPLHFGLVGVLLLATSGLLSAQQQEPSDGVEASSPREESSPVEIHGFLQTNNSIRPFRSGDFASQLLKAEQRGQLELSHKSPQWDANVKLDFLYDAVEAEASTQLREGYISCYGKNLDLRVGKQIITWGVGDLVFLTDVFPKDWAGFITGAPIEYLKEGSTGLRANYEKKGVGLEAIVIPEFEPDTFPTSDRLSFFTPYPQAADRILDPSERSEYGLRLSKTLSGFSSSLYLFSGRDPFPIVHFDPATSTATTRFGPLGMVGLSTQGNTKKGLLSAEAAYYRTEDTAGTDPEINNPSLKTLIGLERTLKGNETLGFQFTQDWMLRYGDYRRALPAGFPSRDSVLNTLTVRWRNSLRNDTVKPTLFGLYNLNDRDWFVKAEAQMEIRSGVWYLVGAHLFGGGKPYTMFGQFDHNDNVYFTVRAAF
ncbi:MAG: hypothetical protein HY318_05560 [Armatimonadetes bacterium]|nr:hypothetical protein [Armatimonadota bacterium]